MEQKLQLCNDFQKHSITKQHRYVYVRFNHIRFRDVCSWQTIGMLTTSVLFIQSYAMFPSAFNISQNIPHSNATFTLHNSQYNAMSEVFRLILHLQGPSTTTCTVKIVSHMRKQRCYSNSLNALKVFVHIYAHGKPPIRYVHKSLL